MSICSDTGNHHWIDHLKVSGARMPHERFCLDCGKKERYTYYKTLREANGARQIEWGAQQLSRSFKLCELAGEVGEACNILKKLEREEMKIAGSRASSIHLMEELADVVICLDLWGMFNDINPVVFGSSFTGENLDWSYTEIGARMAHRLGFLCDILQLDPERIKSSIVPLMGLTYMAATKCGGDLDFWVEKKFNETSTKIGLLTRMGEQP